MTTCSAMFHRPGATPRLFPGEIEVPQPHSGEVLIRVRAAGVNRADVDQSRGEYSPPPGASPILGLEVAGDVVAVAGDVSRFRPGMRVMALVAGGGYAAYCTANEATTFPIPEGLSYVEAAAIPEAYFTVWANLVELGRLQPGETLLVHGGTSGVGSATIQIAKLRGATVIATAGAPAKCAAARQLGADLVVNYQQQDFVAACESFRGGVDVVLDWIGASYLEKHLRILKPDGRLVFIDARSGEQTAIDLGIVMTKRLTLTGSLLRPRTLAVKRRIAQAIERELLPHLAAGVLRPLLHGALPLERAQEAHDRMEAGQLLGKIILEIHHASQ